MSDTQKMIIENAKNIIKETDPKEISWSELAWKGITQIVDCIDSIDRLQQKQSKLLDKFILT